MKKKCQLWFTTTQKIPFLLFLLEIILICKILWIMTNVMLNLLQECFHQIKSNRIKSNMYIVVLKTAIVVFIHHIVDVVNKFPHNIAHVIGEHTIYMRSEKHNRIFLVIEGTLNWMICFYHAHTKRYRSNIYHSSWAYSQHCALFKYIKNISF